MGSLTSHPLRQSSHQRLPVTDRDAITAVRAAVTGCTDRLRTGAGFAALASDTAAELAGNLLCHAVSGGWILLRPLPPYGVEILAVDRGPGLPDVAVPAGPATAARQRGGGLARVRAASSRFDVHSHPDRGTVILSVVGAAPVDVAHPPAGDPQSAADTVPPRPRRWAGISIGIDEACGDGWAVAEDPAGLTVALVDGLGHGVHASMAADAAIAALADDPTDLEGYLGHANAVMRDTRGAALAVCRLDRGRAELRCLSVGNISARLRHDGGQHAIVAFNGTVGARDKPPATRITHHPWHPGATLVMWSDGLPSHLDLAARPDLFGHDPAVVAAALHRDHARESDDATVVVLGDPGRS